LLKKASAAKIFTRLSLVAACLLMIFALSIASIAGIHVYGIKLVGGIFVGEQHAIDVPFYYQVKSYYCGPAALQMVFDFYGENISQFEIADAARTVPYVTYTDELRRAAHFSNISTSMGNEMPENITGYTARRLGYAAFEMGGMALDDLKSLIKQDFPMILLMRWVPGEEYGHYRVAVGYNETHVFLHDPWNNVEWGGDYGGPNLAMNYTFFADMWNYSGNWSLFVSPWRVVIDTPRVVYVGQRFTVTANITYTCPSPFSSYEYPASSCNATIILSEDLTLADSENSTKNIGSLQAGDTAQAFWMVEAKRSGNYSVMLVEAEGKIGGFVGEKPDVGPSYDYQDRIGDYASSLVTATTASKIYISGVDPPEGSPGTKVRVFGGDASPNASVVALISGPTQVLVIGSTTVSDIIVVNMTAGWTVADKDGSWEIVFTVPDIPHGNYTIFVVDNGTLTSDAIGFGVLTAVAGIRISLVATTSGPPGTIVYLNGDGATANGEVRIYYDETNVANTTAGEDGLWNTRFAVPQIGPGNYTIAALDASSNTTDTRMFTVTPPPTIHVLPQESDIGSKITITGEGFPPKTGLYVFLEDLLLFSPIATDDKGEFNVTLFVPVINSGNYTLKAVPMMYPYEFKAVATTNFTVTIGLDTIISKLSEMQEALDHNQNETRNALDKIISNLAGTQQSLNQSVNMTQNALDEATASKESANTAETRANEARNYALTAMILATITVLLSGTTLFKYLAELRRKEKTTST